MDDESMPREVGLSDVVRSCAWECTDTTGTILRQMTSNTFKYQRLFLPGEPLYDQAALDSARHAIYAAEAAQLTAPLHARIETLLRGINDARQLMDPIWRERMGAESVREYVQRGLRCIDSAITDCRFTGPNV